LGRLLRSPSLLTLGAAEAVSGVGNWITMIAVFALVVFDGNGSVASSSGIWLAGLLPTLLLSPAAGWLCDRLDRKWLMVASEVLSGLCVTAMVLTQRLELLYGLIALQGAAGTVMSPARQAAVPSLVHSADLPRANAFLQQVTGLVKIGAPLLAGLLLALVSPRQAMLLDVVSFGISALLLSRLPSLPPAATPRVRAGDGSPPSVSRGRIPSALRLLIGLQFATVLAIMGFDVLSSIFARDVLRADESFYGLLIGLIGLGTVAAASGLFLVSRPNPWADLAAGLLLVAAIPAALAVSAALPSVALARAIAGAGCLLGGVGNGLLVVQAATLVQRLSPPALLGRVGGAQQSAVAAAQLLAIVATPLLVPGLLGLGAYFALATLALALLASATYWGTRHVSHLRREPGQAAP
jgi:MFS family permease